MFWILICDFFQMVSILFIKIDLIQVHLRIQFQDSQIRKL